MKYCYLIGCLSLSALPATAQTKQEKEVSKAVEALRLAMISGKKEDIELITSGKLSYGHSNGKVETKEEFVDNIVSGRSVFVSIDLTEQTISVSGNTAVVRHILSAVTNDGGQPGSVKIKILLVFKKEKGSWKLLARQAVRLA